MISEKNKALLSCLGLTDFQDMRSDEELLSALAASLASVRDSISTLNAVAKTESAKSRETEWMLAEMQTMMTQVRVTAAHATLMLGLSENTHPTAVIYYMLARCLEES